MSEVTLYSQATELDTETRVLLSTLVASVMAGVVADVADFYRQKEVFPRLIFCQTRQVSPLQDL